MTAPTISSVVVNWNTVDLLDRCLTALSEHAATGWDSEVIVVDNASTDGSADLVRRTWPRATLIENATNLGYQRANNQALEVATGSLVLLVNADAIVGQGALDAMVRRLQRSERVGAVGPRLVYGDGSWQRWTAGRAPDLASTASFYLFGERLRRSWAERSVFMAADVETAFRPDWVSSACMLVRREALDSAGHLDERYFCYMDDVDLCQRLRDQGWEIWYEPAAEVVHLMGQSTKRSTGGSSPAAIKNYNDYVTRQHGRLAGAAARLVEAAGFSARAATYGALAVTRGQGAYARAARQHLRNARVSLSWGKV